MGLPGKNYGERSNSSLLEHVRVTRQTNNNTTKQWSLDHCPFTISLTTNGRKFPRKPNPEQPAKFIIDPWDSRGTGGAKPSSKKKRGTRKKSSDAPGPWQSTSCLLCKHGLWTMEAADPQLSWTSSAMDHTVVLPMHIVLRQGRLAGTSKNLEGILLQCGQTQKIICRLLVIRKSLHTSWLLSNQLEVVELYE